MSDLKWEFLLPTKPTTKSSMTRRRWSLWRAHPFCHYCKKELQWEESTIEHLYSRVKTGKRQLPEDGVGRRILSCSKCNNDQAKKEWGTLPRTEQWMRTGAYPRLRRRDLSWSERKLIFKITWLKLKPQHIEFNAKTKRTKRSAKEKRKRAWVMSGSYPKPSRHDLSWQDVIFIIYHKVAA